MTDLREEARTTREALDGVEMSPEEVVRLRQRIDAALEKKPSLWPKVIPVLGAAAAGVAVAAVGIVPKMSDHPAGWAEIAQGEACVQRAAGELRVREDCEQPVMIVVADAGRVELTGGSRVSHIEHGVRMHTGAARFDIDAKAVQDSFEVEVSHGVIITLGTLFRVEQRVDEGQVELVRGRLAFQWRDGLRQEIGPDEVLHWPRVEAEAEPETETESETETETVVKRPRKASRPAKPEPVEPEVESEPVPDDVITVMRRFSQLRSQRRYPEAAELLRKAAARTDFSAVQRERLSFELGTLLGDHLGGPSAACEHWKAHQKRFPSGVRADRVRELVAECN